MSCHIIVLFSFILWLNCFASSAFPNKAHRYARDATPVAKSEGEGEEEVAAGDEETASEGQS